LWGALISFLFTFAEATWAGLLTLDFFAFLATRTEAPDPIHEETANSKNLGKIVSASGLGSAS
jgi:hypothetical protein